MPGSPYPKPLFKRSSKLTVRSIEAPATWRIQNARRMARSRDATRGPSAAQLSAQFDHLRRSIVSGDIPLRLGIEQLDALARLARTASEPELSRRILYFLARVASVHGADHATALRALAHARVSMRRNFPPREGIELRIREAEALGHAGDLAGACASLSEVLRMRGTESVEPLRFHALWSMIDLLLANGAIEQSSRALNWGLTRSAVERSWKPFSYVLQLLEAHVAVQRAYLSHSFYAEALIAPRPTEVDDFPRLSEQARASVLRLIDADHTRAGVPDELFSEEALIFVRDQVVFAAELLRPEDSQIERATTAIEAWMRSGHLRPLAYIAEHLAMALIGKSRAPLAVNVLERVLERWNAGGKSDDVSDSLLYCLYKAHQACGNDAAALKHYRRYAHSSRRSFRRGAAVPELHLPTQAGPDRRHASHATTPRYLRKAMQIMAEEFADAGLTVEALAARAGVSDRTLRAAFMLHIGRSPVNYLRDLRLDKARELMLVMIRSRQDRPSVRQIALECGISHPGRFARAFAQRFGQSPSALLRSAETDDVVR